MIEKEYKLSKSNEKTIEKLVMDENLHYIHMIFNKGEWLPEHFANSNVYMTVLRGHLSIALNDQEVHIYDAGTLVKITFETKMKINNFDEETLELIVVKAPAPKS